MRKTPLVVAFSTSLMACAAESGSGALEVAEAAPSQRDHSATDIAWLPAEVVAHAAAIDQAAARHHVDARLVAIVVLVESGGRADALSPIGARGLMQIMPATASDIARRHGLPRPTAESLDPVATNLDYGARLLAELIADFGDPSLDAESVHRVASAYNGGSGVVLGSATPSEETRHYAAKVVKLWAARDDVQRP